MKAALAALMVAVAVATGGCGGSSQKPQTTGGAVVQHGTGDAIRYESVGVTLTPVRTQYRPALSRSAVLALLRRRGLGHAYSTARPVVRLQTVEGAYPAWVITFRHARCTSVSIYDLRARIWTWNFANCLNPGAPATCEGECTPANQPALDAAASYAERVAGAAHVFSGVAVDDNANTVIVHLVRAPESVLAELRAHHPGIYVIRNDAPRSLHDVMKFAHELDPGALKTKGIDVVQWGPTQNGYLQVGVSSNVATAQAFFDAKYGEGVVHVVHAEPAVGL
jgi:hypothetical protein